MNLFRQMRDEVARLIEVLAEEGSIPAGLDTRRISVEPPRDPAHGDMATNAAMVLAKPAAMKPRDLAALLVDRLGQSPGVRE
ncbi:MAG: arginine--tRNA ligase, partial [Alphaproteobacteria bacterium]|nr:arginine--tRNA ligase [Alphaproteobacteria bacterium]